MSRIPNPLLTVDETARLYEGGLSISQIAARFECGTSSVYRRLLCAGVQIRPNGWDRKGKPMSEAHREAISRGHLRSEKTTARRTAKQVACEHCGKIVVKHLAHMKGRRHTFCSHACYSAWRSAHIRGERHPNWKRQERICAHCGKAVPLPPSRATRARSSFCSAQCHARWLEETGAIRAHSNPNWRGGTTDAVVRLRGFAAYRRWRAAVLERDQHTCQHCGKKGRRMHAHHIIPLRERPDLRHGVDNGETLCGSCHIREHRRRGDLP